MSVMYRPHDRLSQCIAPYQGKRFPEVYELFEMHPRALYVFALVLAIVVRTACDDKIKWYSGLRSILKNCPLESWNTSGQDEFLETFGLCVQQRAVDTLNALLDDDVISIFDGVDLIRLRSNDNNNTEHNDLGDGASWSTVIWNRLIRVLRTHAFKIDVDHMFNMTSTINTSEPDVNSNIIEGRKRRRRKNLFPILLMGLLLMGSILVPMGFQFLAVLGGKALLLAKMALILSSIQGLKKIATNSVHYGLYHIPDGWHDRSHQIPEEETPYPMYPPQRA